MPSTRITHCVSPPFLTARTARHCRAPRTAGNCGQPCPAQRPEHCELPPPVRTFLRQVPSTKSSLDLQPFYWALPVRSSDIARDQDSVESGCAAVHHCTSRAAHYTLRTPPPCPRPPSALPSAPSQYYDQGPPKGKPAPIPPGFNEIRKSKKLFEIIG